MQCHEVAQFLSAYYDNELPPDRVAAVEWHVESCSKCAAELDSFRQLTGLTSQLYQPSPPLYIWRRIAQQLDGNVSQNMPTAKPFRRKRNLAWLALALFVTIGATWLGQALWHSHQDHHLALNFGEFLRTFEDSPEQAQEFLAQNYSGKQVSLEEAVRELKYRPIVATGLPSDYKLTQATLLKMPCCRCLESCFERKKGGMICIFEHDEDQAIWFDKRPVSSTICCGKTTRLVHGKGWIGASWQHQRRHITVIGATDIDEVKRLITHFELPQSTTIQ